MKIFRLQLAAAWLAGSAACPGEQGGLADTERLIVAGNSLGPSDTIYEVEECWSSLTSCLSILLSPR